MRTKRLGKNGPQVSALGFGCSRLSTKSGADESVATLQAALDAGMSFLDTADFYGMGHNQMAADKGYTSAQLAVAWLLSRGDDVVPIVGMSRRARLPENMAVLDIRFSTAELAALDRVFALGAIRGERYPAFVSKLAAQ